MNDMTYTGLTAAEAAERSARGQVNRVRRSDWAEYRDIVARNLFTLFNALVVPAAAALFLLREYQDAWAVSGMVLVNTVIGLAQEIRAKRHLDRLAILVETKARVLRDGEAQTIPAGEVVLGDHLLLAAGEPIVADGTVLQSRYLEVDEALLTGESDPVPRQPGAPVLSGSFCVAGEGLYRADKVGGEAFAHQTAAQARSYHYSASPLQKVINFLVKTLTYTAVGMCVLYIALHLSRGEKWADIPRDRDLVKMISATVTSMVPQGLVLMATLAFTLGAVRMSARGAIVQRLSAVESMAAVDVLCMDKTGTLTTNRLRLDQVRVLTQALSEEAVRDRLRTFAALSVDRQSKSILALHAALGEPQGNSLELVDQLPFKSQNRYSALRVREGQTERVLVLGAYEALQPYLAKELATENTEGTKRKENVQPQPDRIPKPGADTSLSPLPSVSSVSSVANSWRELLATGLRLLLFAEAEQPAPLGASLEGFTLRPLALVALSDELRPEAGGVLEALAAQGIGFKIISGDNPETVRATVGPLDLPLAREPVVSGDQLESAPDHGELIRTRSVFGRVAPRQKVEIVTTLRQQGHHVAMIGDGVNDVLPIKRADLGIAMGEGSAAAKTVSGLVLENNNFELLPATLEEGRTILRNLRRCGKIFLLKNVYMFLLIIGALAVFGLAFPFLPRQVTLLNALTIGIPALVITLSRERSLVPSRESYLREVGWFVLPTGAVIAVAGLAVFLISARWRGDDLQTQRTLLLSTLILLGLVSLLRALTQGEARPLLGPTWFHGWVLAAIPVYGLIMYWRLAGDFFALTPLTVAQWALVLAVTVPAALLCLLIDWLQER